VLYFLE